MLVKSLQRNGVTEIKSLSLLFKEVLLVHNGFEAQLKDNGRLSDFDETFELKICGAKVPYLLIKCGPSQF
jgi:hypothetical protein